MNFVAHLFLSPCNDAFRVGAILADFTVGKIDVLEARYGLEIAKGIRHHREVDRFTDTHEAVFTCVDKIKAEFGLYGSIVTDVMFDHYLLIHWKSFSKIRKETFFESIYQSLTLIRPEFPERYRQVVQRILERRWLRTYEEPENVAYALRRIGERFQRPTPLANALPGIRRHYKLMEETFFRFFPELQSFSDSMVESLDRQFPC